MKLFNLMLCGALTLGLISCSDKDDLTGGGNPDNGNSAGDFYATINLSFPTANGSRSATDNGQNDNTNSDAGYEIGQDYENNIQSLIVIMATKEGDTYKYLTHATSSSGLVGDKDTKTYTLAFKHEVLQDHAGESGIYVFAIANPGTALINSINDEKNFDFDDIFDSGAAGQQSPWKYADNTGEFLMTNKFISASVTLPSISQFPQHSTAEKAFNLGEVMIERAAVRFDFRPVTIPGETKANYYPIKVSDAEDAATMAYVELTDLALFNQAKKFYYFRRVSDNGYTDTDGGANYALCGREYYDGPTSFNYVVGPYAKEFTKDNYIGGDNFYIHNNGATDMSWETLISGTTATIAESKWTSISSLKDDDDTAGDNPSTGGTWHDDAGGYKIWRYTTENVLPQVKNATGNNRYAYQIKGATTGVVFKGHLRPAADLKTGEDAENTENPVNYAIHKKLPIYQYGKTLYGSTINLAYTAKYAEKGTLLEVDFDKSFDITYVEANNEEQEAGKKHHQVTIKVNGVDQTVDQIASVKPKEGVDNAKLKANGFLVFKYNTDADPYPVYYPYYNRHNDNGSNTAMGGMEFATVRNNVYKLAVETIKTVGKPVYAVDDPHDPDETAEIYFTVTCKIMPWVVRLNNIDF